MASADSARFSYDAYRSLLSLCLESGYGFCGYTDWHDLSKAIILRHDIDYSLKRALPIARIESEMGIKSTYFILLRGDFYNVFSDDAMRVIRSLADMGHAIGLHFDETLYGGGISCALYSMRHRCLRGRLGQRWNAYRCIDPARGH